MDVDTWFWPVIQAGELGVKEEEAALGRVWEAVRASHAPTAVVNGANHGQKQDQGFSQEQEKQSAALSRTKVEVDITSGYFGLYKKYKQWIIDSPALTRVIAASPEVCDSSFFTPDRWS